MKFLVYAVVEALPLSSSTRVLIETTILNGLGYLLVAVACWIIAGQCKFQRRWSDVVLPLTWLTSLSGRGWADQGHAIWLEFWGAMPRMFRSSDEGSN